jgi:hypothetical protein
MLQPLQVGLQQRSVHRSWLATSKLSATAVGKLSVAQLPILP